jgi:ABC-type uncharacterized transport system fused permease/ATPase subunit
MDLPRVCAVRCFASSSLSYAAGPLHSLCLLRRCCCCAGKIEFGVITQSSSAFNHILNDVSLVVYQVPVGARVQLQLQLAAAHVLWLQLA